MCRLMTAALLTLACTSAAAVPAFDCRKARGEVEQLICRDDELGRFDARMAAVHAAAQRKAANEHPPTLAAEQRGWVKGRNDCWKSSDIRQCIVEEYRRRIAELQARYRLVAARGPFFFACDGSAANELLVTHFATDPVSLIAERGDQASLMFLQPAASGARYQGRNESFWEHQGEAWVTWGYGAAETRCIARGG